MNRIINADVLEGLKQISDGSVNCCVTSPPYWGLRDYGVDGQLGLESTPEEYVEKMVAVFREVRRALRDDGTLWLNLGDSYANQKSGDTYSGFNDRYFDRETDGGKQSQTVSNANVGKLNFNGLKPKDLVGIPWRVAFALQADGWYLRQDIIWHKPNPMPESVTDRCTKAHEYIFLMAKSARYYYDADAIKCPVAPSSASRLSQPTLNQQGGSVRVPGKTNGNMRAVGNRETCNRRSVWSITTQPFSEAHFATFPPNLIKPCILAGCPTGGIVLDPFMGSGTTAIVATNLGRNYIGIEINPEYVAMANARIERESDKTEMLFAEVTA